MDNWLQRRLIRAVMLRTLRDVVTVLPPPPGLLIVRPPRYTVETAAQAAERDVEELMSDPEVTAHVQQGQVMGPKMLDFLKSGPLAEAATACRAAMEAARNRRLKSRDNWMKTALCILLLLLAGLWLEVSRVLR